MTDEEKKEYEELKSLLYTGKISQYGKRKLIDIIEKQSKEIEKKEFHLKATEQQREYDMKMIDDLKGLLNNKIDLIKEQQKEIEELKAKRSWVHIKENGEVEPLFYVSEDKIKAKIEVMNTNIVNAEKFDCDFIVQCRFAKYVLNSLLEKE